MGILWHDEITNVVVHSISNNMRKTEEIEFWKMINRRFSQMRLTVLLHEFVQTFFAEHTSENTLFNEQWAITSRFEFTNEWTRNSFLKIITDKTYETSIKGTYYCNITDSPKTALSQFFADSYHSFGVIGESCSWLDSIGFGVKRWSSCFLRRHIDVLTSLKVER